MPSYVRGKQDRAISDAEIIRMYVDEDMDSESIGFHAHCSGTTVIAIVRAAGHPIRKAGRGVARKRGIDDDEIIKRYRAGQDGVRIANAAGCTPNTIYRVLRANGVVVRPPPSGKRRLPDGR
jgi:hypothetical protein